MNTNILYVCCHAVGVYSMPEEDAKHGIEGYLEKCHQQADYDDQTYMVEFMFQALETDIARRITYERLHANSRRFAGS